MNHLSVTMTPGERLLSLLYLIFQLWGLPDLLAFLNRKLPTPLPSAVLNMIYFSLNFIVVVLILRKFWKATLRDLWKNIWHVLWTAVLGFSLYWMLTKVVTVLIFMTDPNFYNVNDSSIAQTSKGYLALMSVGTVILVPVVEECLYRGLVFGALANRSKWQAYVICIFVFAFVHVMGYIGSYPIPTLMLNFLQYIPSGLCLAWTYSYADNIVAPILVHAAVNAMGMYAMR